MATMDSRVWDDRYAASELVWSAGPNAMVAELTGDLPPGRALDLAAGEGRNAIWLAERGWDATAVDFSAVAMERARRIGDERLGTADAGRLTTVAADVLRWAASGTAYDLVLVIFLHLPEAQRRVVHRRAADALAPGGMLLVLAHDRSNLDGGVGGPQDPEILPTPEEVVGDLDGIPGLSVDRSEVILRPVVTDDGERMARDCLVVAQRQRG
jgi:SAM-dependent methyltransferase